MRYHSFRESCSEQILMEFRETLNLPRTGMPDNLDQKTERRIIDRWYATDLYGKICDERKNQPVFVLLDGPPYANGHIHIGYALNKILKDIIVKFKTMTGYRVPFIPGWDCHGLPIEHNVLTELKSALKTMTNLEIRAECAAYAERFVNIMREEFRRLGVLAEWERPYLTMSKSYEAVVVKELLQMLSDGRIHYGQQPVFWCSSCQTALGEAEIEYKIREDLSLDVVFDAVKLPDSIISDQFFIEQLKFVCTENYPWMLPACTAIALNPDKKMFLARKGSLVYAGSKELLNSPAFGHFSSGAEIFAEVQAVELDNAVCRHPFYNRDLPVVTDHWSLAETPAVRPLSPSMNICDFHLVSKKGIDSFDPVDASGCYNSILKWVGGTSILESSVKIRDLIHANRQLIRNDVYESDFPFCWRCKKPVINRLSKQWFISMQYGDLRSNAVIASQDVEWIPEQGKAEILKVLSSARDWCISRQRVWGIPITAFRCRQCHHILSSESVNKRIVEAIRLHGSDIWFTGTDDVFLGKNVRCAYCNHDKFDRENDIVDVWFESGVSHRAVLTSVHGLRWPATLGLECSDQYNGWFRSSMLTAVANYRRSPFETICVHGKVVDTQGSNISKSAANDIDPEQLIQSYGADTLRLWSVSSDIHSEKMISDSILHEIKADLDEFRGFCKDIIAHLYDYFQEEGAPLLFPLMPIDKAFFEKWECVAKKVRWYLERFDIRMAVQTLMDFYLSDFRHGYWEMVQDRLRCERKNGHHRRTAQITLHMVLGDLLKALAPVLAITTEEIWSYIPGKKSSIHLESYPGDRSDECGETMIQKWDALLQFKHWLDQEITSRNLDRRRICVAGMIPPDILEGLNLLGNRAYLDLEIAAVDVTAQALETKSFLSAVALNLCTGATCLRCSNYYQEANINNESSSGLCERCEKMKQDLLF